MGRPQPQQGGAVAAKPKVMSTLVRGNRNTGDQTDTLIWKERYQQDLYFTGQPAAEGTLRDHHKRRFAHHKRALRHNTFASARPTMFEFSHTGRLPPRGASVPAQAVQPIATVAP